MPEFDREKIRQEAGWSGEFVKDVITKAIALGVYDDEEGSVAKRAPARQKVAADTSPFVALAANVKNAMLSARSFTEKASSELKSSGVDIDTKANPQNMFSVQNETSLYIGGEKEGKKHGCGVEWLTDGSRFIGNYEDGKPSIGTCVYANGDTFEGNFSSEGNTLIPSGMCSCSMPNGTQIWFEGQGKSISGSVLEFSADGGLVEGKKIDGKWDGVVTRYSKTGETLKDTYSSGQLIS